MLFQAAFPFRSSANLYASLQELRQENHLHWFGFLSFCSTLHEWGAAPITKFFEWETVRGGEEEVKGEARFVPLNQWDN